MGRPSFIRVIFAPGSVLLVQSAFDSFLPFRSRSSRTRSSGSASRCRSPGPFASASRDRSCRCHDARSFAAPRWLPSSRRRRRSARPSPDRARPPAPRPSQIPLVDLVRKPAARLRQPRVIGNLVPVRQPQEVPQRIKSEQRQRCRAHWRSPRNNRPCACGNNVQAAMTVRPSSAHNMACSLSTKRSVRPVQNTCSRS